MKVLNLVQRIKWKPVLALVLIILIAVFFLFGGLTIQSPFKENWKGEGDIQAMSWADPSTVETDGTAKVRVSIRNVGEDSGRVEVRLAANDPSLAFEESGDTQEVNASVSLGSKETRELSFKVNFNAAYAGRYRVNLTVAAPGENIPDEIFFDVREKK